MADTCRCCGDDLPDGPTNCQRCGTTRNASWATMLAGHVTEHLADGLSDPAAIADALMARGCYVVPLTPAYVRRVMREVTTDTTTLARQIAKARASRTMLEVLETGDTKDKLTVLKGIQVLGDVVEHTGEVTTRFVVETHDGAPPKATDG